MKSKSRNSKCKRVNEKVKVETVNVIINEK